MARLLPPERTLAKPVMPGKSQQIRRKGEEERQTKREERKRKDITERRKTKKGEERRDKEWGRLGGKIGGEKTCLP